MANESKLIKKLKRLLRRLGCPRWLHRFGPKTYDFIEHLAALLLRALCRLSFRLVKQLFDLLGIKCPSKSALQYTAAKLSSGFWQKVLAVTCGASHLIALDSTGLSRTNPSYHYLKRIDGKLPKVPVKLSIAFNTAKKKYAAAKIRVLPAHDIRDAAALLHLSKPKVAVADKAYDAYWLHDLCKEQGIQAHIPLRTWSKPRFKRGRQRFKAAKKFRTRTYHRRELAESAFSSLKRKFGSNINCRTVRNIRTEIYSRLACHNIIGRLTRLLGQSPLQFWLGLQEGCTAA